jgi:hypothetical protein
MKRVASYIYRVEIVAVEAYVSEGIKLLFKCE